MAKSIPLIAFLPHGQPLGDLIQFRRVSIMSGVREEIGGVEYVQLGCPECY